MDPLEQPSDNPSGGRQPGGEPPRGPDGSDTPPTPPAKKPRRVRQLWKAIAWGIAVPALRVALVGGLLYGVVVTERSTAYAWQAAVKVLNGQLAG
ncbi:hypothetical protein PTKU64_87770 [Paraburkholderia terrae]|uniref:Uncharacterized protein n=1 Tax=Paraburkholderia terrae TaxID=311230 RepID=A0ABM7U1M2_9BURK|nr:hypothetical protein [Paraburkholderia terrae]BCZ85102.1 hypothetical protein PTKU64_87770 [Paraburkholderia terrae]